jgi:Flp pilus assembly protein TadG
MTRFVSSLRRFGLATGAAAAIEFVFILPFLLFLFFGMVDLTGLIGLNRKVTQSASVVADLVSQHRNSVLKPQIGDYYSAVSQIMSPIPVGDVHVEIRGYRPSGGSVAQDWMTSNGSGPSCGTPPTAASLLPLTTAGNDLVMARVCMNFEPYIATFLGKDILGDTSFLIEETITLRPRSTGQLTCYNTTVGGAKC